MNTVTATPAGHSLAPPRERMTLAETLDRVLNKGAVIVGDLTISVADVDLLYIGLSVVVTSVDRLRGTSPEPQS